VSLFTRSSAPADPAPEERGSPDEELTVEISRKRFARRRWVRRWVAWRRVVLPVLALVLVGAGVWLVFFSSVLAVSGVQVVGTRVLDPAQVRAAAAVPTGVPLATADLGAVAARVRHLRAVKSVDVSRSWPDAVRVAVVERRAVAVVVTGGAGAPLQGVDGDGVVFRRFAERPAGLPVLRMQGHTGAAALADAAAVAGSMPADLARHVAFVRVGSVDSISLQLHNGRLVTWGSAQDSRDKARVLEVLLGQHASFYDVSVPSRPVIKK
jgi:cell division septal protein FtsQ